MISVCRFLRDQDGYILVYGTLLILPLLGFAFLAVEASRYKDHHTQLQKAADAAALAAAAELDRSPQSIERATNAINNIVTGAMQNTSPFGTQAKNGIPFNVGTDVRFLEALPNSDDQAFTAVTDDPTKARFVEVHVSREEQGNVTEFFLPPGVSGAPNQAPASAVAVAGFDTAVCKFHPLYICNPIEGSGYSIQEWVNTPSLRRKMIILKSNTQAAPGNFNYLRPPNMPNAGAAALNDMIAQTEPNTCFAMSSVCTKPGQMSGIRDGFNVRFDIYNADMAKYGPNGNSTGNPDYGPAPSVRKGWTLKGWKPGEPLPNNQNWCNTVPPPADQKAAYAPYGMGFPLDSGQESSILGNGSWDLNDYWENNYGSGPPQSFASRWDAYKYGVSNQALLDKTSGSGETSGPQCFKNAPANAERRTLYGAVINCQEHQDKMNGAACNIPVEAFAKFFLLQPVDPPPQDNVYVEMVEVFKPPSEVVHDIVQLYR